MRMCLGCNEMKPKGQLCRVVRNKEGTLSLDLTGKAAGRGAYLCRNQDCLARARKARRLERALACQIPDSIYERLEAEIHAAT